MEEVTGNERLDGDRIEGKSVPAQKMYRLFNFLELNRRISTLDPGRRSGAIPNYLESVWVPFTPILKEPIDREVSVEERDKGEILSLHLTLRFVEEDLFKMFSETGTGAGVEVRATVSLFIKDSLRIIKWAVGVSGKELMNYTQFTIPKKGVYEMFQDETIGGLSIPFSCVGFKLNNEGSFLSGQLGGCKSTSSPCSNPERLLKSLKGSGMEDCLLGNDVEEISVLLDDLFPALFTTKGDFSETES